MRIIIFSRPLIKEYPLYLKTLIFQWKDLGKRSFQSSLTAVLQCTLKHRAQIGNSCLHAITD